eukprot:8734099-Alexandrium_andersonii.AAC.1
MAEGARHLFRRVLIGAAANGTQHNGRAARVDRRSEDGLHASKHEASVALRRVTAPRVQWRGLDLGGAGDKADSEGLLQERVARRLRATGDRNALAQEAAAQ